MCLCVGGGRHGHHNGRNNTPNDAWGEARPQLLSMQRNGSRMFVHTKLDDAMPRPYRVSEEPQEQARQRKERKGTLSTLRYQRHRTSAQALCYAPGNTLHRRRCAWLQSGGASATLVIMHIAAHCSVDRMGHEVSLPSARQLLPRAQHLLCCHDIIHAQGPPLQRALDGLLEGERQDVVGCAVHGDQRAQDSNAQLHRPEPS